MARTRTAAIKAKIETASPSAEAHAADAATAPTQARAAELREIAVAEIATDGSNPRTLFDLDGDAGIKGLAASIKAQGLLQPIIVRPNPDATATHYLLVAGERRLRAVRDVLKRATITAIVRPALDPREALEATVLENLQRRDLHPMEEARGLDRLRATYGYTPAQIAARVGRRTEWVKERLMLCGLPAEAQDAYLHSASGRLTLGRMLALHEYTHGGRDNAGFPALITALVAEMEMEMGRNPDGHLATLAVAHSDLVKRLTHWGHSQEGQWGGHFFDTRDVCRRCPFGAYRPSYYDGEGYCLLPDHYAELQARGQARFEAAMAARERQRREDPASSEAEVNRQSAYLATAKTPAQKGAETRRRHQQQKADYYPHVQAITRAVDLIANVDGVDVAVLAAYTLTHQHVDREAVEQVIKRHSLKSFPGPIATPTRAQIERLRQIEPVALVRYTLEALLLTQARRARDFDPGRTPPDAVLALYLPGQALPHAPARDPIAEVLSTVDCETAVEIAAMRERGREALLPGVAEAMEAARRQGHEPISAMAPDDEAAYCVVIRCTACGQSGYVGEDGSRMGEQMFDRPCSARNATEEANHAA